MKNTRKLSHWNQFSVGCKIEMMLLKVGLNDGLRWLNRCGHLPSMRSHHVLEFQELLKHHDVKINRRWKLIGLILLRRDDTLERDLLNLLRRDETFERDLLRRDDTFERDLLRRVNNIQRDLTQNCGLIILLQVESSIINAAVALIVIVVVVVSICGFFILDSDSSKLAKLLQLSVLFQQKIVLFFKFSQKSIALNPESIGLPFEQVPLLFDLQRILPHVLDVRAELGEDVVQFLHLLGFDLSDGSEGLEISLDNLDKNDKHYIQGHTTIENTSTAIVERGEKQINLT